MSKLSNLLNMYQLLQGRRLITINELSEILEVSPRRIKEYKNDLEKAGVYINSKRGRYGGYYIENYLDLKGLGISKEEIESLKMANEIISSANYTFSLDFELFTNKIVNYKKDFEYIEYFNKDNLKSSLIKEIETKMWKVVNRAIINKRKINMVYKSLSNGDLKSNDISRIVHPYGMFDHEGASYFFGYCETRKQVRYFKLSRIKRIEILDQKFEKNIKYDIKDMMRKSFGIMDDDVFNLKLRISYPMSQLVKEKQYSINQRIQDVDESNIIFETEIKGYKEVKTWVLGMGSCVEVIEPYKLKQDLIEEIRKLQKIYE